MGTIYLVIYSKYKTISVMIISKPFMLIILLEYTCNMVVHIHFKFLIHSIIFLKIHKIQLCIFIGL